MKQGRASPHSELLLRLALTALLLYALAHFTVAQLTLSRTEALTASLEEERAALTAERAELERKLAEGESAEALAERAYRELGLLKPGEIVFIFRESGAD